MPRARARLSASSAPASITPAADRIPPIAAGTWSVSAMPAANSATPGKSSHATRRAGHSARSGCFVATGSSWKAAPNAVAAKTPSVSKCSTASTRPGPITKFGISAAAQTTPHQNAR